MSSDAALGVTALVEHTGGAMWDERKSRRLDELRLEEARRALSADERAELLSLFAELDADEAEALRPAIERAVREVDELRVEKAQVDARTRELERIVEQQERLLAEVRLCRTREGVSR